MENSRVVEEKNEKEKMENSRLRQRNKIQVSAEK
jgi:hypothetical protein